MYEMAHVVEGTANTEAWQFPLPREQRGEGGSQEEFHSFISSFIHSTVPQDQPICAGPSADVSKRPRGEWPKQGTTQCPWPLGEQGLRPAAPT